MFDKNHFESIAKLTLDKNSHDVNFLNAYGNNPKGVERIEYWLSFDVWKRQEAVAILLDLEPDEIDKNDNGRIQGCVSFSGYLTVKREFHEIVEGGRVVTCVPIPVDQDAYGKELYLTVEQEQQLSEINHLYLNYARLFRSFEIASPAEWIQNALTKKIYIPWFEWAVENNIYNDKHQVAAQTPISNKERESMLKIIKALAKNGYKYPDRGSRKDMVDDFDRNNNGVDEKTLKKYLDEADRL